MNAPPTGAPADVEVLLRLAEPLLGTLPLGRSDFTAASVAAAIRTRAGNTYTGVCVDVSCGLGFCAEHAAVAEMLKGRETEIEMVVAVGADGPLAPCGRCRELMVQVNPNNLGARVVLPGYRVVALRDLLPHPWMTVDEA